MSRPQIRRTSRLSSIPNSMTESSLAFLFSSKPSNWKTEQIFVTFHREMYDRDNKYLLTFSACTTVRGKPSKRKPFLHSGLAKLESIRFTTRSSLTRAPIWKKKHSFKLHKNEWIYESTFTFVHFLFQGLSKFRPWSYFSSKHVTGSQVADTIFFLQPRGLLITTYIWS